MAKRSIGLASAAVAVAGAAWGLFWIPMRGMEAAGLAGGWAAVIYFIPCVLLLAPGIARNPHPLGGAGFDAWITGFFASAGLSFYAVALLHTDVVRAILLFYTTPLWSTLLERYLSGEPITGRRQLSLLLGAAGLMMILGWELGFPLPSNYGDWLALISGISWAYGCFRINCGPALGALTSTFIFMCAGALTSTAIVVLSPGGVPELPAWSDLNLELALWLALTVAITLPLMATVLWAAEQLSPARLGLLLMTEVIVGTWSAALFAGETFSGREMAGAVLIIAAGLLESATRAKPAANA